MPPRKGTRKAAKKDEAEGTGTSASNEPAGRVTRSLRSKASNTSIATHAESETSESPLHTPERPKSMRQTIEPHSTAKRTSTFQPAVLGTPRHTIFGNGAVRSPFPRGAPRAGLISPEPGARAGRTILTPVFGRKYTRAQIDLPFTPKRPHVAGDGSATPMDAMRVAVSKTPYTAKRTIADYEEERDPIKTYVRLKPADPDMLAGQLPKSLLQVVSDKEVEMVKGLADDSLCERYLFAGVLPTLAKQPRVFEVCALPVVRDLFSGYNTLLFTYGITNSGKTYTVQGTSESPGMLPCSIKAILDVLDRHEAQGDFAIRPRYATQVEYCSDPRVVAPTFRVAPDEDRWVEGIEANSAVEDPQLEELTKELGEGESDWVYQLYVSYFEVYNEMIYDLLDLTTLTTVHVKSPNTEAAEAAMQAASSGRSGSTRGGRGRGRGKRAAAGRGGRKRGGAAANDDAGASDAINMSSAQIAGLPRTALLLRSEGGRGNEAFVDGVTEVRIRSARDLVRVLIHGQMRRSVHATGMNTGSSRSHALFQAKLVKIRRNTQIVPLSQVPAEAQASVRTMTIVDLAGSERAKRTHNQGDRLAEAGKINVSLMTLKKCLDVKRYNASLASSTHGGSRPSSMLGEHTGGAQLVPYNESKVTRLFQPALEGGAKTIMVVCVDPYEHNGVVENNETPRSSIAGPSLSFTETKNVLDFARVASSLVTKVRRVEDPLVPATTPLHTLGAASRIGASVVDLESPTASKRTHGPARSLADGSDREATDDEDEEDEVFFDTDVRRESMAAALVRKRTSSAMSIDVGVQTEESLTQVAATKRQRNNLSGNWHDPAVSPSGPTAEQPTTPVKSSRSSSMSIEADPLPVNPISPSVWETITKNSPFNFELPPERIQREAPLLLSRAFLMNSEHKREISSLKSSLADTKRRLKAMEAEKEAEINELVEYASSLEAAASELRQKYVDAQELSIRIEAETRVEVSSFFMDKIAQIKDAAHDRLHDELSRSEAKSAHKIDILSRLRSLRGPQDENDDDEDARISADAAEVPTVSPRSAVRRAVSRAASKKANKITSVSAGENKEIVNLRTMVESLEAQISSQQTQLDMIGQARNADRATREALEGALIESQGRVTTLEGKLLRLTSAHSAEAELAITRAHEQERAEFLAQITMLKLRLREAETQAMRARRQWETQELLPVQERLRMMMSAAAHSETTGDSDLAETLERAERDRDSAWEWWTREQERNSQLCAQNDVLMREIRHLRGQLRNGDNSQQRSAQGSIRSSSPTDSEDGSFCKVSLSSINSISAINGGNPLGATSLGVSPSRPSVSGSAVSTPMRALSRVVSKGRALHRNHQAPKHMSQNMDSVDSFAQSSTNLSPLQGGHRQGRLEQKAKRVVSRVFQHFTPDSKRRGDANKPYLAGRFANTDAAVGSYSAEVLSFEQGPLRDRGNSVDTRAAAGDQSPADARMAKVRSIVYSGPIVAHPTGGVSVTFTSQEVHELPIDTNSIPEQLEDEAALEASHRVALSSIEEEASGNGRSSSPQGTKRTRAMMHKMAVRSAQEQMKAAGKHADVEDDDAAMSGSGDEDEDYEDEDGGREEYGDDPEYGDPHDAYEDESGASGDERMPAAKSRPSTRSTDKSSSRSAGKGKGKQASTASSRSASQSVASVGISSAATIHSTGKKKRKLHAGRTVLNIGSPDSDYEEDSIANAPQVPAARSRPITPLSRTTPSKMAGAWPQASPSFTPMSPVSAMVAKAAQPEENKQPVLFTPIRTRSKVKLRDLTPTHDGVLGGQREEKSESIFLTPMKMLSRLRNRKK